ncbi:MAG: ABC transporter permease [Proteobacteria bacterium]|nr:ABC transporter permease [Pseudomonadota bacterium]
MNRRIEKNRAKPATPEARTKFSLRAWREQHLYSLFSSLGRLAARPWATALTLAVLGFALALPILFGLLLDNARGLAGNVGEASSISAFLKPGTKADEAQAFATRLRARADVAGVGVKTPEQGLDEFRERSGFAEALKVLHYNPLPPVLIVEPRGDAEALVAQLRGEALVDQVQYDAQWRQRLNAILGLAQRGAQVLAGLLALAALLVIGNTVRLDIAGRSEEIAVMQLLGAEAGFVRRPFLYSGFWYGTFAGMLSLMLIVIVQFILAAPLARLAAVYDHAFVVHGLGVVQMLAVLAAAAAIGWLGAFLAASRHIALGQPR